MHISTHGISGLIDSTNPQHAVNGVGVMSPTLNICVYNYDFTSPPGENDCHARGTELLLARLRGFFHREKKKASNHLEIFV